MKIAAVGDIHTKETDEGIFQSMFAEVSQIADVLLLCGDLTDHGLAAEAHILVHNLRACTIPVIAVLGNHDYERGEQEEIKAVMGNSRVTVLDGESIELKGVGFAGIKGFCGGFDNHVLTSFGEQSIKVFVDEAVSDALRLETALKRLETEKKVVLMHYAPLKETIVGEPPEIFPFLGCSRFMGPMERFGVTVAFHGHAHHGALTATSAKGVIVHNVAHPVLQAQAGISYMVVEV